MSRFLTFNTIQTIHRMAREGKFAREIAAELGLKLNTVRYHARGSLRGKGKRTMTAAELIWKHPRVVELRAQGLSLGEIGKELKVSRQAISKLLRRIRAATT